MSVRHLAFRRTELLTNLLLRSTLRGLVPGIAAQLAPPWPDLVITAGRRNEPVARWIRRAAGGTPKLVHIGRPWAAPKLFDLIVTTPQYFVPPAHNVLQIDLPLLPRVELPRPPGTAELQGWQQRLAGLARPWVAVLVGGDSGPYRLTATRARALGNLLRDAVRDGGSLLVTTSGRTSAAAVAALAAVLPPGGHFFDWHRDPRDDNPYRAYLALADRFVVTAESASMLAEACATGRPVAMFDLGAAPHERFESWRWKPLTFALGQRLAPRRLRRDIGRIHTRLIERGHAYWLGAPPVARAPAPAGNVDELALAVTRVLQLFDPPHSSG